MITTFRPSSINFLATFKISVVLPLFEGPEKAIAAFFIFLRIFKIYADYSKFRLFKSKIYLK